MLRKFLISTLLASPLLLTGCSGIPIVDQVLGSTKKEREEASKLAAISQANEVPPSVLLNTGIKNVNKGEGKKAQEAFNKVGSQHPFSTEAQRALVLSAYAHFASKQYPQTITKAQQFIQLYPGNKDAAYMHYLIGESYTSNIGSVVLDQGDTAKGLQAYSDLVRLYPQSKYVPDSRRKMLFLADQLAGKEMQIGRYYQERRQHLAAVNRFRTVVQRHQKTRHVEEALFRLTESYLALGLVNDATSATSLLGHNYPDSRWYADAFELSTGRGGGSSGKLPITSKIADAIPIIGPLIDDGTGYRAPDEGFVPNDSKGRGENTLGTVEFPDVPGLEENGAVAAPNAVSESPNILPAAGTQPIPAVQQKKRGLSRFVPFVGKKKVEQDQELLVPPTNAPDVSGLPPVITTPDVSAPPIENSSNEVGLPDLPASNQIVVSQAQPEVAVEEKKRGLSRFIPFVGKKDN